MKKIDKLLQGGSEVTIKDFKDSRSIGTGQLSQVIQVHAKKDHKIYAIKKFDKKFIKKTNSLFYIKNEIDILTYLGESTHITKMITYFEDQASIYIQLEYANDGNLRQKLMKERKMEDQQALFYIKQIIDSLEYLHSKNLIYRDLRPENILIKKNEKKVLQVKLCDFGLSTISGQKLVGGVVDYSAPEIYLQMPYTQSVDIWSLGVVIHELLTGKLPFDPTIAQLKRGKKQDILLRNVTQNRYNLSPLISVGARDLLLMIFQLDIDKRPTLAEIKSHWWITNRPRPASMENKINMVSILDDDEEDEQSTIITQEDKTSEVNKSQQIINARQSIQKKIQVAFHHRKISQVKFEFQSTFDKSQNELNQRLNMYKQELENSKQEQQKLFVQLMQLSQDTSHFINGRESVINFINFDSEHRQKFYKSQKLQIPILKNEKYCQKLTIQQQQEDIQAFQQCDVIVVEKDKELKQLKQYKNQLKDAYLMLEKQIQDIQDKRIRMEFDCEEQVYDKHIETEQSLHSWENVKVSNDNCQTVLKCVDMIEQQLNNQIKQNRKNMKNQFGDLFNTVLQDEQEDYEAKIKQIDENYENQIKDFNVKKQQIEAENLQIQQEIKQKQEYIQTFNLDEFKSKIAGLKEDLQNLESNEDGLTRILLFQNNKERDLENMLAKLRK
ncbi:hypothetical protein pb186bvf_008447 [Paramecium bursaria]